MVQQPFSIKIVGPIFETQLHLSVKRFEGPDNTVFRKDGFVCYDIGWCSRFNKSTDVINYIDIGLGDIMEVTVTNNQVSP